MNDSSAQNTDQGAAGVTTAQWLAAYLAAWLVMLAPVLALDTISADRPFVVLTAVIWLAAFPVSFFLRTTRVPRAAVNFPVVLLCFALAVPLIGGRLGIRVANLNVEQAVLGLSDADALEFLIRFFIWIMVFRAFTVRTVRDLTLCTVPSISALVLTVILHPDIGMLVFFCSVLLGGMYLLAADHRIAAAMRSDFVAGGSGRRRQPEGGPRPTWLVVYIGTLVFGAALCLLLTRITVATDLTRSLKLQVAQRLAGFIIRRTRVPYGGVGGGIYLHRAAPTLGDTVMFTVRASREANWRLTAYDLFRGHAWEQRNRQLRPLAGRGPAYTVPPTVTGSDDVRSGEIDDPSAPEFAYTDGARVEQHVTLQQPFHGAIIGAYRPVAYVGPGRRLRYDQYGGLVTSSVLLAGSMYAVTSLVPVPRSTSESVARSPYPATVEEGRCLELPPETPRTVLALARTITMDADSPYTKALRIETYLGQAHTYDANVGPTPRHRDPVEFFLFDSRRGYCLHFATAMAVLCRAVGVPARLAVGYSPGDYDTEADEYVVRERHEHAWPEVYLKGSGWVAFDPTRVAADTQLTGLAAAYQDISAWWQGIVQRVPLLGVGPLRRLAVFLLVALATLAGGVSAIRQSRRATSVGAHAALLGDAPSRRLVRAYWAMCNGASRRGLRRQRSQTAFEFADLLSEAAPGAREPVWWLTETYARCVFGERRPSERTARLAEARSRRVLDSLRRGHVRARTTEEQLRAGDAGTGGRAER